MDKNKMGIVFILISIIAIPTIMIWVGYTLDPKNIDEILGIDFSIIVESLNALLR